MAGALIRKQLFEQSDDYSPMNFTYSIVSRAMSIIASPDRVRSSKISKSALSQTFMNSELIISGLLPMIYSAMTMGGEIETGILNLLQFHFVSPLLWLSNNLVYFMLIS